MRRKRTVETQEFQRVSLFSKALRSVVSPIILGLADKKDRRVFSTQVPEASRNIEIALEGLLKLLTVHPVKATYVLGTLQNWISTYFEAQLLAESKRRYLVYTEFDAGIPFLPEEDTMYAYMLSQIAYVASELATNMSASEMYEMAQGFVDANHIGAEAFRLYPSLMPRFLEHQRLSLRVVQYLDRPVNCCPSLHIAYSVLLDNIARNVISKSSDRSAVFDSIRYSTLRMFNSVLYTKQHSLVDVAFGILCAKIVFEKRFEKQFGYPFDDFISVFAQLKTDHPEVSYDTIERIYREALSIQEETRNLADTLGVYFRRHGFIALEAGDDGWGRYFDTKTQRLIAW